MSQGVDLIYDNTHSHRHAEDGKEHHHATGVEPHIWNSATNAQIIAGNILSALCSIDKSNESAYLERYSHLPPDRAYRQPHTADAHRSRRRPRLYDLHPGAFPISARDYGLHQIPIEAGGKEPSPAHLKALIDTCKSEKVHVIFVQPEFDRRNAEIIAKQTGTRIVDINPLSYDWEAEMLNTAKALNLMKNYNETYY